MRPFVSLILFAQFLFIHVYGSGMEKNPKIVVVGAGLAGLTTAYRLHQHGWDVEVYEARNRVGGRVFTVQVGDSLAELGAVNILDGGEAHNLRQLIQELGLETEGYIRFLSLKYFDGQTVRNVDKRLSNLGFSQEEIMAKLQAAARSAANMQEVLDALVKADDPIYTILKVHLAAYEGAPLHKLSTFYIKTLYHLLLGGLSSVHPGSSGEESKIEFQFVKGGNSLITESLAEALQGRVHCQQPLKSIEKTKSGRYKLNFGAKESVEADIVILAIPCKVYDDIEFEDSVIPDERLKVIRQVEYGTNAKILFPVSPYNTQGKPHTNGKVVLFFNRDMRVANVYYTYDYGHFTPETIEEVFQHDFKFIEKAYTLLPFAKPPVVAEDKAFVRYEGPVGVSWPLDPYSKGSYSCVGAGQEETFCRLEEVGNERVKTLFAPVDDTLYFAGEHATIDLDTGGTMEAAVESGERTARMILKVLK